jgi:hypothetical protein
VSHSIIHTAITDKTVRLELDYRQPSALRENDAGIEAPTTEVGLVPQYHDSQVSDEFACLLRVI